MEASLTCTKFAEHTEQNLNDTTAFWSGIPKFPTPLDRAGCGGRQKCYFETEICSMLLSALYLSAGS